MMSLRRVATETTSQPLLQVRSPVPPPARPSATPCNTICAEECDRCRRRSTRRVGHFAATVGYALGARDLDPIAASGIDTLIRRLNDTLGITVVIVTHDLTTLLTVCGRIAVLVDRNITIGTADQLMKSDHPWIHDFFHGPRAEGAMNARSASHGI